MKNFILLLLVTVVGLTGCETKIDLNADYKQIPVIYGMLEGNKDIQLVKINRSFLGETNALVAAQVPDSTFYANISPVIEKLDEGVVIGTRSLRDTILADRLPGDFYVSPNKYYWFSNNDGFLNKDFEYRLKFTAGVTEIFAETVILEAFEPKSPLNFNPSLSIVRNDAVAQGKVDYQSISVQVTSKENMRLFQTHMSVKYKTLYRNGTETEEELLIPLEDVITTRLSGGERLESVITGESIYGAIGAYASTDTETEDDVKYRELGVVELKITAATDELNTYLESVAPSSGVVLEKPQFTNINFGEDDLGIGIFTSRSSFIKDYVWDLKSTKAFSVDQNTRDLKFCTFDPALQGVQRVDCRTFN